MVFKIFIQNGFFLFHTFFYFKFVSNSILKMQFLDKFRLSYFETMVSKFVLNVVSKCGFVLISFKKKTNLNNSFKTYPKPILHLVKGPI